MDVQRIANPPYRRLKVWLEVTSLSLLVPVPNRYFMVLLPFALFFEREMLLLFGRHKNSDTEL